MVVVVVVVVVRAKGRGMRDSNESYEGLRSKSIKERSYKRVDMIDEKRESPIEKEMKPGY